MKIEYTMENQREEDKIVCLMFKWESYTPYSQSVQGSEP